MYNLTELDNDELMKFARSIEKDCQEAVKWEIRKLEWILDEERKQVGAKDKAA